ncbi:MAG: HAD hydrolase-like protein, partial [Sphingomonadaceae bacterium]|nr:HAD hydrolase-like protein [Sphingomonadaceae bacterium]
MAPYAQIVSEEIACRTRTHCERTRGERRTRPRRADARGRAVKLAIFDCDGTLVDGQASICEAMEAAFAAADLPAPDRHTIRRIVGLSLPQALRMLAPDASEDQHAIALETYKHAFRTSRINGTLEEPLFDGMAELIERLTDAGWSLAVATGKSDRGLTSCLAAHGLIDRFVSLQTADRHPSKPDPAMLEAALIE